MTSPAICIRIETFTRPPARCVEPKRHAPRFKILYLPYFMNDCEFNGLPQSDLAVNRIYHADCLEGMKLLPARSVDMILSDPPYGVTANAWDSIIDLERLWAEYKRNHQAQGRNHSHGPLSL